MTSDNPTDPLVEAVAKALCAFDVSAVREGISTDSERGDFYRRGATAALAAARPIILEEAAKVVLERADLDLVTTTRNGQRNRAYDTAEAVRSLGAPK